MYWTYPEIVILYSKHIFLLCGTWTLLLVSIREANWSGHCQFASVQKVHASAGQLQSCLVSVPSRTVQLRKFRNLKLASTHALHGNWQYIKARIQRISILRHWNNNTGTSQCLLTAVVYVTFCLSLLWHKMSFIFHNTSTFFSSIRTLSLRCTLKYKRWGHLYKYNIVVNFRLFGIF